MKFIKFLLLTVFLIGLFSCNKEETEEINNIEVENYIELLKANQYESGDLPEFSFKHIPALLMYINDTNVVNKYPHGPSSYAPLNPNYRLGVLVVWTIEFIRVKSSDSTRLFVYRFPSQNPIIQKRDKPFEWITDHDNEVYEIVRQAYFDWWEYNKYKDFDEFKNIDPLIETDYSWH